MDAQDILARVVERYATCETYRDEVVYFDATIPRLKLNRCSTRFVRGKGFRFDWTRLNQDSVSTHLTIWKEGDDAYRWGDLVPEKMSGAIRSHLAAAAGISQGMSVRVPALLLAEEFGPMRWKAARVLDGGADAPAGVVRIEYEVFLAYEVLTIDLATLLIVRCDEELPEVHGARTFYAEHWVTEYRPEVNVEVLPEETRFTPEA
jgi:hypothetical protein